MDSVVRQTEELQRVCCDPHTTLAEQSTAVTALAHAVVALDSADHANAITSHLVPLAPLLGRLLSGPGKTVSTALIRVANQTGVAFKPFADAILQTLRDPSITSPSQVTTARSDYEVFQFSRLLNVTATRSRFNPKVVCDVYAASSQASVHKILLKQLQNVLAHWPKGDIGSCTDVFAVMRQGLCDPDVAVRDACHKTFREFLKHWMHEVEPLVKHLPAREKDAVVRAFEKEMPYVAIPKAAVRISRAIAASDKTACISPPRKASPPETPSTIVAPEPVEDDEIDHTRRAAKCEDERKPNAARHGSDIEICWPPQLMRTATLRRRVSLRASSSSAPALRRAERIQSLLSIKSLQRATRKTLQRSLATKIKDAPTTTQAAPIPELLPQIVSSRVTQTTFQLPPSSPDFVHVRSTFCFARLHRPSKHVAGTRAAPVPYTFASFHDSVARSRQACLPEPPVLSRLEQQALCVSNQDASDASRVQLHPMTTIFPATTPASGCIGTMLCVGFVLAVITFVSFSFGHSLV